MNEIGSKQRIILVNAIIGVLNEQLKKQNEELCRQNLYIDQKPLHGFEMAITLMAMPDDKLKKVADACGI